MKNTLFCASSFVLPIFYEKPKIELKELSRKLQMYRTLIEVNENIKIEKDAILEFKRSLEGTDKRYVEILTIFSAIVLFASANIQIFSKEGMDLANALRFMLCFAYCLSMFVFLIWWVMHSRDKEDLPKKTWIFLILLAIATAGALIFMHQHTV